MNNRAKFVLHVKNTLIAYLQLASYIRKKINPITIAITGSSGKTTTKEMLNAICSPNFKTHKSKLNHNNEIGLCETICTMPIDTEVLIVEMGMRNLGEIELLSKYCAPDVGIITNIGPAHVGILGNIKNIAKAKCEIASNIHAEGVLIAPKCPLIEENVNFKGKIEFIPFEDIKISKMEENQTKFIFNAHEFTLNVNGEYNVQNAVLAIVSAHFLGLSNEKIEHALKNYKPIEKRWETENINGINVINDSYNSNPDALKAAIKAFCTVCKPPYTVVIGDMAELGKDEIKYHKEIGEFINAYPDLKLVTLGTLAKYITKAAKNKAFSFKDHKSCAKHLLDAAQKGETVLLKASRVMQFEKIIEEMKKQ